MYIFYNILLKKQNSFLKKKNNLLNNYYSAVQKFKNNEDFALDQVGDLSYSFSKINFFVASVSKFDTSKVLDLRKKLKKTILENRKIFANFLLFNSKRSYRLNKKILLLGGKRI